MCLYPIFIKNRKYTVTKKNNGIIPTIKDERTRYVPVGCGKCMECRKQKARSWQVRLHEEIRTDKTGLFVTFSFSDESINQLEKDLNTNLKGYNLDNQILKLSVKRFLERWRKKYKISIKHWFVTELGQTNTERIHIHGLIFTNHSLKTIEEIWKYGNVWIGDYVNEKTINYIIKYVHKTDPKHKYYIPLVLCSPGIGNNYINRIDSKTNKFNKDKTNETYTTRTGIKLRLPIYYRNKLYTDEQKEELWLNLLNKNIRYVNKVKIDVSINENDYNREINYARTINKLLGYSDNEINKEQKQYEQDLRNLKRLQRINKYGEPPKIQNKTKPKNQTRTC